MAKKYRVKDLMVPLADYALISTTDSLYDAITALNDTHNKEASRFKHQAVLVYDKDSREVVGRLSFWGILKGLDPKYRQLTGHHKLTRFGYGPDFAGQMARQHRLFETPLEEACVKSAEIPVTDLMLTIEHDEYVEEDDSLDHAVHVLVMGDHHSLLVTKDHKVTGVLRLTDIFQAISELARACAVTPESKGKDT